MKGITRILIETWLADTPNRFTVIYDGSTPQSKKTKLLAKLELLPVVITEEVKQLYPPFLRPYLHTVKLYHTYGGRLVGEARAKEYKRLTENATNNESRTQAKSVRQG